VSRITKPYIWLGPFTTQNNVELKKGDIIVVFATSGVGNVDVSLVSSAGGLTQRHSAKYNTNGTTPDSICVRVYTVDNDMITDITTPGTAPGQVTIVFRDAQIVDFDSTGKVTGSPTQTIPDDLPIGMGVLMINRYTGPLNPNTYTMHSHNSASIHTLDNIRTQYAQSSTVSSNGGIYSAVVALLLAESNRQPNTPPTNNPKGTQAAPAVLTTLTPTLDWSFSDPDAGNMQSAYQVRIKDVATGTYIHDTGKVADSITDYTVPENVLQLNKTYTWEVSTWDDYDIQSAWSSPEYFTIIPTGGIGDKYTFDYTGGAQTWQVPGNVIKVKIEAWGAEGGSNTLYSPAKSGGKGGYAVGETTVTPGEILHIYVGGKGKSTTNRNGGAGGWNGGGNGGTSAADYNNGGGGGGGASDVRRGGTALSNRIIVAGGGGGAAPGVYGNGGAGGGLIGDNGDCSTSSGHNPAGGGTQTTGGAAGVYPNYPGTAGSFGQGGNGGGGSISNAGAGGGGGYYGGGGGGASFGGGGGSSFIGMLENANTLSGQRTGDGQVVITVIAINNAGLTFINRTPGNTDQTAPEGTSVAPTLTWDYNQTFNQAKYQVKIFDGNTVVHDTGVIESASKSYAVPAGVLQGGKIYGWEVTGTDVNGSQVPSNRLYFITNNIPGKPIPDHVPDTLRVGKHPVFTATVNNDVEDDSQSFVLQLATDSAFTQGLLTFDSSIRVEGWEYFDGTTWQPFPLGGKIAAENEGRKVRYTVGVDPYYGDPLVEGKTYYWRMAAKDGATETLSDWTDEQKLTNLLGTAGACDSTTGWTTSGASAAVDTSVKTAGSGSLKITIAAGQTVGVAAKYISDNWKAGKYYLVIGHVRNESAAKAWISTGGVGYTPDGPVGRFGVVYKKFTPSTDQPMRIELRVQGEENQYAYFDQVRAYEISKAEYDAIGVDPRYSGDMLAIMYPYVDNTQTIQRKARIRCGTTLQLKLKQPIKQTAPVDRVVLSKFATLPIVVTSPKRMEGNDPAITYTGTWSDMDGSASGGSFRYTSTAGASAELTFIGTGIRWAGSKAGDYGLADVYLDDVYVATIDQYTASAATRSVVLYENLNLPYGPHKIKVVCRREKNSASIGYFTDVDYFEIVDTMQPAQLTVEVCNNGFDATPTWEDCTNAWNTGEYYRLTNTVKTAADWGLDLRITVDAKDRLDEISLDAFGASYD
jgi:hypothetical protein